MRLGHVGRDEKRENFLLVDRIVRSLLQCLAEVRYRGDLRFSQLSVILGNRQLIHHELTQGGLAGNCSSCVGLRLGPVACDSLNII